MAGDYLTFIRELPRSFSQIGAMLPSSQFLSRSMVRPIREADRPLTILEVGPGTGPITREILKLMDGHDSFVICEINERFLSRLKTSLEDNAHYHRNEERVTFFHGAVQNLAELYEPHSFDVIVSSLPLANFTPEQVRSIFDLYASLLAEGGSLVFFEYVGLRRIGIPFRSSESCARVRAVDRIIRQWCDTAASCGSIRKRLTLLNLPPAISIQLSLGH